VVVALLDLDVLPTAVDAEPFVVVVDRDGEDLLGAPLADHVLVELLLDGTRRGDVRGGRLRPAAALLLLVDDRLAQLDALAADVDVAGPLHEGADVAVAAAAERAIGVAVAAGGARGAASARVAGGAVRRHWAPLAGNSKQQENPKSETRQKLG